jgi:hypothetical protein
VLNVVIALAILSTLAWFGLRAYQLHVVFLVRIRDGQATVDRGRVTTAFVGAVQDLCREHGVSTGEIRGYSNGSVIRLWFAAGIPEVFRQQLRNWWTISGWPLKVRSNCR